jgi:hypothetical protein
LGGGGANIAPEVVQNLPPNNTNLNSTNITTTKGEKAAAVAVNFKKIKEKGDLSACLPERVFSQTGSAQAEEKMQAIREQLMDLDFEESFIKKLLKDYSLKKIKEKIDLLLNKRNIQNPPAWLMSALKNDYRDPQSSNVIASSDLSECGNPNCRGVLLIRPYYNKYSGW